MGAEPPHGGMASALWVCAYPGNPHIWLRPDAKNSRKRSYLPACRAPPITGQNRRLNQNRHPAFLARKSIKTRTAVYKVAFLAC